MYLVKILNADHRPVDVEVSLEIYRVYEESRKQEERQRYERRKHIEGRAFDDCLMFDLATEPLEEYCRTSGNFAGNRPGAGETSSVAAVAFHSPFFLRLFLFGDSENAGLQ